MLSWFIQHHPLFSFRSQRYLLLYSLTPRQSAYICLRGPNSKIRTGHLDCPLSGILGQPPPFWICPGSGFGRMQLSTGHSITVCGWSSLWAIWAHYLSSHWVFFKFSVKKKMSREKTQLRQTKVTYLGLVLAGGTRALKKNRTQPILAFPLSRTLKQLRAFWRGDRLLQDLDPRVCRSVSTPISSP
jgi:hypothetical protein